MNPQKYSVSSAGPRIEQFLRPVLQQAGFRMDYEICLLYTSFNSEKDGWELLAGDYQAFAGPLTSPFHISE